MKSFKSLKGGDYFMNDNMFYVILFIILIIIVIIAVYILFFRKSNLSITTPTYTPTSSPTSSPTYTPNKIKRTIDKIKSSKVIKNIEADLKEWQNDIEKLPLELKEAAINCYSNPQGCIF